MEIKNQQNGRITLELDKSVPANPVFVLKENQIIAGFGWEIRELKTHLNHDEGLLDLEFLIHCKNSSGNLFLAQAEIVQRGRSENYLAPNSIHYFYNNEKNLKIENSLYYDANDLEEVVHVDINVLRGFSSLMEFDTSLEITWSESQEIGDPEQKNDLIVVHKYVLATKSDYFRKLFFGEWKEGSQQQFKINEGLDFDCVAFKKMIYTSMMMGFLMSNEQFECLLLGTINDKNLKYKMTIKMLQLSVQYFMPMIQDSCENYLASQFLRDKTFSKMELLEQVENLGLHKLKASILASMDAYDFCNELRTNLQILDRLQNQTRDEVINKVQHGNGNKPKPVKITYASHG